MFGVTYAWPSGPPRIQPLRLAGPRLRVQAKTLVTLTLTLTLLSGCGTAAGNDGAEAAAPAPATTAAKPAPRHTDSTIEERCNVPIEGDLRPLPGPGGSTISVAVLGDGPRAAVFLHQTSGAGMCGFATYAVWAAKRGVRAILVDLCGWGQSRCEGSLNEDWTAQVRIPVEWARAHGASSVTLVGASMGGALALGVGQKVGADAVVDLSGPSAWQGVPDAVPAARATSVPLLVAAAPSDAGIGVAQLREAVAVAPAKHKRYISAPDGHGWSMLSDGMAVDPVFTPLASTVLAWVKGDYSAR